MGTRLPQVPAVLLLLLLVAACHCQPGCLPAKLHVPWCGCELTSFFLSLQYEVSGEEHLYSDFPEIDLSQLDASDLDSASCFSELQWCAEHSETESSQYSTDDSELFQVPRGHRDVGRRPSGCWSQAARLHLPMGDC